MKQQKSWILDSACDCDVLRAISCLFPKVVWKTLQVVISLERLNFSVDLNACNFARL